MFKALEDAEGEGEAIYGGQMRSEGGCPGGGDEGYLRPRVPTPERPQCSRRGDEIPEVQTTEHNELLCPHRKTPAGTEDACSNCKAAPTTVSGAMPVRHSWPMGQTRL